MAEAPLKLEIKRFEEEIREFVKKVEASVKELEIERENFLEKFRSCVKELRKKLRKTKSRK